MFRLLWTCLILSQSWQMKPLLHLGSNVITDGPLLHLGPVITLVPSTTSTDEKSGNLDPDSSFISFWGSFRGIFWEVLGTVKLTQSQMGIDGLKNVNSLNRCIKFRKRNRLLGTFVVFFTALWTFWHLTL